MALIGAWGETFGRQSVAVGRPRHNSGFFHSTVTRFTGIPEAGDHDHAGFERRKQGFCYVAVDASETVVEMLEGLSVGDPVS